MRALILSTTTGYQIRSFGQSAAALGVELVFASDRCDQLEDPWFDRAIPVRFHDIPHSVDAILAAAQSRPLDGVIAVGDRPTQLAAHVSERLALPGNSPAAAAAARSKLATRRALSAAGLLAPRFVTVAPGDDVEAVTRDIGFPAVVKPIALSASRGVVRVNSPAELIAAVARVRRILESPDVREEREALHARLLVERFIPGREFAVEGLLTKGSFRALAIFDKPDPMDGPYFEETIYVTPSRAPAAEQAAIVEAIATAASALGLRHGPVHAECRVNESGVWVLEVAPRPIGGSCAQSLRFVRAAAGAGGGGGIPFEELLLRHALGEDVSDLVREPRASAVMMIPIPRRGVFKGVEGVDEASRVAGIDAIQISAKRDVLLLPLPEGRSYLGFIFAHGDSPEQAEQSVRRAHAMLNVRIEREIEVT